MLTPTSAITATTSSRLPLEDVHAMNALMHAVQLGFADELKRSIGNGLSLMERLTDRLRSASTLIVRLEGRKDPTGESQSLTLGDDMAEADRMLAEMGNLGVLTEPVPARYPVIVRVTTRGDNGQDTTEASLVWMTAEERQGLPAPYDSKVPIDGDIGQWRDVGVLTGWGARPLPPCDEVSRRTAGGTTTEWFCFDSFINRPITTQQIDTWKAVMPSVIARCVDELKGAQQQTESNLGALEDAISKALESSRKIRRELERFQDQRSRDSVIDQNRAGDMRREFINPGRWGGRDLQDRLAESSRSDALVTQATRSEPRSAERAQAQSDLAESARPQPQPTRKD